MRKVQGKEKLEIEVLYYRTRDNYFCILCFATETQRH